MHKKKKLIDRGKRSKILTMREVSKYGVSFGLYFSVFGPEKTLHLQCECSKANHNISKNQHSFLEKGPVQKEVLP